MAELGGNEKERREAAFARRYGPRLLVLLLGLLTLSHLYPQDAYPLQRIPLGVGFLLLYLLGLLLLAPLKSLWDRPLRPAVGMMLLGAFAWPVFWGLGLFWAPVPALARDSVDIFFQGYLVFAAAMCGVLCWSRAGEDYSSLTHPVRVASAWLGGLAAVLAVHGLYQVWGPASWPGTHAAMAATIEAGAGLYSESIREGLLHALREGRASSRIGSPNLFAGVLAIAMPLVLGMAARDRQRRRWGIWLGVAGLLMLGIFESGSRGGMLAAFGGIGLFGLLRFGLARKPAAIGAALALAIILAAGAAAENSGGELESRWLGTSTVQQRVFYWQTGLDIWSRNWVAGAGPGAFEVFYPQYRRPGAQETAYAHNWIVQWGAEAGLAGLILAGIWLGGVLWLGATWWRTSTRMPAERSLAAGVLAACGVALAHGLVEFTLSYREIYLDACLLFGLAAGFGTVCREGTAHAVSPRLKSLLVAAILMALASAAAWFQNGLQPARAEHLIEQAEFFADAERDYEAALESYNSAYQIAPGDPSLLESRAFIRGRLGDPGARNDLERALKLNPHSARLRQSMALWEAGNGRMRQAIEWQRQAVDLHPLDATHRIVLAELLWEDGQRVEAGAMLASTDDLLISKSEGERRQELRIAWGGKINRTEK